MRTLVSAAAGGIGGFSGAIIGAYVGWSPVTVGILAAAFAFVAVIISRKIPLLL